MSQAPEPLEKPAGVLSYASPEPPEPSGPRPWWVYAIAAIYLLLISAVLALTAWVADNDHDRFLFAGVVTVLLLCGLALIIVPVKSIRRRPITRRSIWVPIIGAGLLAGVLFAAAGLALGEYWKVDDRTADAILIAAGAVWILWSVILIPVAYSRGPMGLGMKIHRALIAGSVLELLIAVPAHIVVRRRPECCAGIATGLAICVGVGIMLISVGPSVLLLFYRRRSQLLGRAGAIGK
jgi:hypothetical protein